MTSEQIRRFGAEPSSVAEWEDLLVRVEIMPRALRANLEDSGVADPMTERVLRELVAREAAAGAWLERAVTGEAPHQGEPSGAAASAEDPRDRFARLRARNFAMVQRRGVEIWGWPVETGEGYRPTVHQVLCWLAETDAQTLARLRGGGPAPGSGGGEAAC